MINASESANSMKVNYNMDDEYHLQSAKDNGLISSMKGRSTSPFGFKVSMSQVQWLSRHDEELEKADFKLSDLAFEEKMRKRDLKKGPPTKPIKAELRAMMKGNKVTFKTESGGSIRSILVDEVTHLKRSSSEPAPRYLEPLLKRTVHRQTTETPD